MFCLTAYRPLNEMELACKCNTSTKSKINNDYIAKMFFGSDHQPNDQLEKDELGEYEAEAIEPTTCDPTAIYDYWAGRCNRWPRLSVMASVIQKPSKLFCACALGTEPCVGCVFHPRWEVHFFIKKVIYCGIVKELTHLSNRYGNPTRLTGATTNN
ncbi:hypothetical protein OUZ56_017272 [Daphnia magna]|uniref:Uncharacterized protein n=1 Tax=Daphnia magna TaxID=35525 RepID=A0ABR0ASL6_9CRUS|nr:hypothetical protein OUZ56_017272 [Daphnia magna]